MATRHLLLVALVLLVSVTASQATIISATNNYTFSSVGTTNLSVSQFNPALGTLNSITVYVYGTGSATFEADNDYVDGVLATANMSHSFLVTAAGVSANGSDSYTNGVGLGADNGDGLGVFDPTGLDGTSWGTVTTGEYAASGSPYSVAAPFWAAYTGTGNVLFGLNSQTFTSEISGSSGWYNPSTAYYLQTSVTNPSLNVRVRVDYDYTPTDPEVPEPATLALLGLGVCGMGWRARRRKAAATQ